ncbi:uncharacterized protein ACA1_347800 [Acanthamoeba castellanii str. Neff]|uniref:Uncharacterized protein n=1 Tax=Acanthamoeba castellanii (strain ATCC 30010 / Neff) TaxID=1257118 RepID=L8GJN3_ACACF|nr:uncharacterized protein ACA1_347800 [Acanthamoeba castellanii str. Neff]ELR13280.1 hypothetical protein ACA1_347800 [Acanthamoeba castellanii str. Neff]
MVVFGGKRNGYFNDVGDRYWYKRKNEWQELIPISGAPSMYAVVRGDERCGYLAVTDSSDSIVKQSGASAWQN